MEKEFIVGEPQRYQFGNRVFIVEPHYRKDGEDINTILLRMMLADVDKQMWDKAHSDEK